MVGKNGENGEKKHFGKVSILVNNLNRIVIEKLYQKFYGQQQWVTWIVERFTNKNRNTLIWFCYIFFFFLQIFFSSIYIAFLFLILHLYYNYTILSKILPLLNNKLLYRIHKLPYGRTCITFVVMIQLNNINLRMLQSQTLVKKSTYIFTIERNEKTYTNKFSSQIM